MEIENATFQDLKNLKKEDFQNCYGKLWIFVWEHFRDIIEWMYLSFELIMYILCLFILLFIIQSTIRQKLIKYIIENSVFLFLWGFIMQMKIHDFGNFAIWLWKRLGKVLKMFHNGVCTNPVESCFI